MVALGTTTDIAKPHPPPKFLAIVFYVVGCRSFSKLHISFTSPSNLEHVLGLQEDTGVPGVNPHGHERNM